MEVDVEHSCVHDHTHCVCNREWGIHSLGRCSPATAIACRSESGVDVSQMPCTHPWATKWTLHEEEKDWIQDLQVGAKVRVTGGKKLWTADIVKYQKYHQFVIKDLVNDDASSGEESE